MGIKGGKGEALRARTALGLHGLTLMIAVPAMLTMTLLPDEPPPVLSWFGVIHFETIFFKAVNDNFGHAVGDRTLQIFAEECRRTLRPSHVVGRIGGEKFAAIYPGSGIEAGWAMAERVRRSFAESAAFVENYPVRCTTSAGVAAGDASDSLDDLLRQADEALYRAKSQGRNRIESYRVLRSENEYIIRVA